MSAMSRFGEPSKNRGAHSGSANDDDDNDDDDDFMSDKYLAEANTVQVEPQSYTERRQKRLQKSKEQGRVRSHAEREVEARRLGLARNLLNGREQDKRRVGLEQRRSASPPSTSRSESSVPQRTPADTNDTDASPALRMMLAMGFKPGQSLGRGSRDTPGDNTAAQNSDEKRPVTPAQASILEPLALDERWLGKRRFGIGSALARDIAKAEEQARIDVSSILQDDIANFRSRARDHSEARRVEALLAQARKTCEELDRTLGMEFSPLWLNPEALSKKKEDLPAHVASLIDHAFAGVGGLNASEQQAGETAAEKERQTRHSSSPGPPGNVDDNAKRMTSLNDAKKSVARAAEAQRFCKLNGRARLDITLSHLRRAHHYCLFCGVQYDNLDDIEGNCPGEDEDDH